MDCTVTGLIEIIPTNDGQIESYDTDKRKISFEVLGKTDGKPSYQIGDEIKDFVPKTIGNGGVLNGKLTNQPSGIRGQAPVKKRSVPPIKKPKTSYGHIIIAVNNNQPGQQCNPSMRTEFQVPGKFTNKEIQALRKKIEEFLTPAKSHFLPKPDCCSTITLRYNDARTFSFLEEPNEDNLNWQEKQCGVPTNLTIEFACTNPKCKCCNHCAKNIATKQCPDKLINVLLLPEICNTK